ncbi:hypothetical protein AOC36_01585 [Erysipelothrix larvae]|uniref:4-alpha-glucanotransferase n=1 Tax=Erysipelothrix larvae TaxID=1514105 RepID=A0A0X8GYG5_9FIRM|nr:4-alpha-glucanotransferase [Erysipelothrix larvae]AMC92723.1 hypothetical protein AOC36_01585 [Erysipelothrix larvae]
MNNRRGGILLAVSSLPGSFGIGDLGKHAYEWIDKLSSTHASLWQILPLNPLGYGNSPYQSYSAFAGDEIYISVEKLYQALGLSVPSFDVKTGHVDYDAVRIKKDVFLKEAYAHFVPDENYEKFVKETAWLHDYAVFMSLRTINGFVSWTQWTRLIPDEDIVNYHKFLQYIFMEQWLELKAYANAKDVLIMGDIPIYLGHDSADVYFNRDLFFLDEDGTSTLVAGVPPDYFSDEGQLWGNPIYAWERMAKDNYRYWVDRLSWNQTMFDIIRIDHFRAFDTYWVVDGKSTTAKDGEWRIGPRNQFFDSMYAQIPDLKIVVEDLGDLRPEVLELRDDYKLKGMQIIQYSIKKEEIERDKTMPQNLLIYTGTHDNQPIGGWVQDNTWKRRMEVRRDIGKCGIKDFNFIDRVCHYTLSLNADYAILPMQDILRLGNAARMNAPGTVGSPNWEWKVVDFDDEFNKRLLKFKIMMEQTNRN